MLLTSRLKWLGLAVVTCVILLVACQSAEPEIVRSATPTPRAVKTVTPTPQATPTETDTPAPTRTPTATREPTATRTTEPTRDRGRAMALSLPEGWRQLGNRRLGLQIAAPEDWIDLSDRARASEWQDSYGPQMLLVSDSRQMVDALLTGQPATGGGFVFGSVSRSILPASDPAAGLLSLLGEAGREESLAYQLIALGSDDQPAAYVDVESIPLTEFENQDQRLSYRLLSVAEPEADVQLLFVMGADQGNWDVYQDIFDQMAHTIVLSLDETRVGQLLESGDQVKGELSWNRVQVWPFHGSAGQYATITLAPENSAIDLTLALVDPDGSILARMDDSYAGDVEMLTDVLLLEEGTYIIEAGEFFKEGGQYQLGLTLADEPQFGGGGRIEFGREINSELAEDGEHIWIFTGTAGQEVSIVLNSLDDQLDVILEFRGPGGQEELILDEGFAGDAEVAIGIELPVTGDYTIVVRGYDGRGGPYSLVLDEGGESTVNFYDAGDLAYGQSAREFLRQDEAHAWFFDGLTGDEVTIEVSPLSDDLDLDIWLLDPRLNDVATKDEFLAGEPEKIEEELQNDGQFLILVREFFGEAGEYEIRLNAGGEDLLEIAGSIEGRSVVSGTLPPGRNVGWTFLGRAGEIINVSLTPTDPDRDLVIVLKNPQGDTVASVDTALSGLPERLSSFRITESGEWMLLIQEFFNEGSGYELSLVKQP